MSSIISAGGSSASGGGASVTSQFRHLKFAPPQQSHHQPTATSPNKSSSDSTTASGGGGKSGSSTSSRLGIMVVGLGGANGTTMLAGIVANRLGIEWKGPKGEHQTPNYNGCITQLSPRGIHGGVGFQGVEVPPPPSPTEGQQDRHYQQRQQNRKLHLADVTNAAVGGWDIRPTKPGDALLQQQILDYDLVRQIQSDMNATCKIFRGLYDPRFIGNSQHATATHVLTEDDCTSDAEALKCLRADIRYFKWRHSIQGHTTVIWSASVEPNSEYVTTLETAQQLMDSIHMTEQQRDGNPLPPSLLYATAAILEGCSFVNGGSQNTLGCPGLWELAKQHLGVYCLGTDFKAGQTKFKTAAVEYLRTMGLTPRVIASSNHLGNNDMRNIATAKAVTTAKLRVKHDIFAPWEEDQLDHKVSIMFTEYINDDKRDFVEYTSLGFLGQPHTMVTYTRASDSVLCVPLMIDAAVWCDYFSCRSWPYEKVSKALAYLFKVPEGGAKGVDPGFFRQMEELKVQVFAAYEVLEGGSPDESTTSQIQNRINPIDVEWTVAHNAKIVCAGLACVDMQLNQATGGDGGEGIETFQGETSIGGGSVAMACKTLGRLIHGEPKADGGTNAPPPVVSAITPLCMIGRDDTGTKLLSLLEKCGSVSSNIDTRPVQQARAKYPSHRTALSVLPIFQDGRRGCFFDAASNSEFSTDQLLEMISDLPPGSYGALLFGYPHLLPLMQGLALGQFFHEARKVMINNGIIALDLNGVSESPIVKAGVLRSLADLRNDGVIGPALEHVDILHMNEDELCLLTGSDLDDDLAIAKAVDLFLECGVAVVAVTRGRKGSFVACNSAARLSKSPCLPQSWADYSVQMPASDLPTGQGVNTNGAGDAYTSGLLVASMLRRSPSVSPGADPSRSNTPSTKKMTPYTLYMKKNYVTLKQQCQDDKAAMFQRCHEMWENESDEVKEMYARMLAEEYEDGEAVDTSIMSGVSDTSGPASTEKEGGVTSPQKTGEKDESLSLESAVQLAALIAAYHVDTGTRNLSHLDLSVLVEQSMMPARKSVPHQRLSSF